MMNGMNYGWVIDFAWALIIGVIALVVIVWLIVKALNQKDNFLSN